MAVTLRNSFPTAAIGAGGGYINKPTGTQAGDLLLLEVVTSEDVVPSPPAGFVLVPGAEITGLNALRVYQKIATSAEPDSYFVYTHSSGGNAGLVAIAPSTLAYAAVHQLATASSNSASSSKVWNGVTNTDPNTVLLCFGSFGSNAASTPDAAMTERWDTGSTRMYLMTQSIAAAGATGTRTATGSSVARQRCITISVTETATKPFELPDEIQVTSLPVLVEVQGEAVYTTALPVLVELGAVGIYLTELAVLVEIEQPPQTLDYYAVALGHNASTSALVAGRLEPQPHSKGVQFTRYHTGNAGVQDENYFIVYEYGVLESRQMYRDALDQHGLLSVAERAITCTARDDRGVWQRWNGTAVRPRMGEDVSYALWPQNINILIKDVRLVQ